MARAYIGREPRGRRLWVVPAVQRNWFRNQCGGGGGFLMREAPPDVAARVVRKCRLLSVVLKEIEREQAEQGSSHPQASGSPDVSSATDTPVAEEAPRKVRRRRRKKTPAEV